jgi:hypothetical protein
MGHAQMMEGVNQAYQTTQLISEAQKRIGEVKKVAVKSQIEILRLSATTNTQKEAFRQMGTIPTSDEEIKDIASTQEAGRTILEDGRSMFTVKFNNSHRGGVEYYYRVIDGLLENDTDFIFSNIITIVNCPKNIKMLIQAHLRYHKRNLQDVIFTDDSKDIHIPTERIKPTVDLRGITSIPQAFQILHTQLKSVPIVARNDVLVLCNDIKVHSKLEQFGYYNVRGQE